MLDERVLSVLARLEAAEARPPTVPVKPTTGRLLFSLVAPQTDCEVLEVGAGRGYSTSLPALRSKVSRRARSFSCRFVMSG